MLVKKILEAFSSKTEINGKAAKKLEINLIALTEMVPLLDRFSSCQITEKEFVSVITKSNMDKNQKNGFLLFLKVFTKPQIKVFLNALSKMKRDYDNNIIPKNKEKKYYKRIVARYLKKALREYFTERFM